MWNQFLIPLLIPTLIIKSNCDTNKTESDIFVYGGHVEGDYNQVSTTTTESTITTTLSTTSTVKPTTKLFGETTVSDNVFFVPNKKVAVKRDDDEYDTSDIKLKDILMMKTANDAMNKNFHVEKADTPNEDIVFITGKNQENEKISKTEENARRNDNYNQIEANYEEFITRPKLNCMDLDCNNTIRSICGAKFINNEWRFRLFLNDCYFRKVNCGFKYEMNRYKQVTVDKCKTIGAHYVDRPFAFKPKTFVLDKPIEVPEGFDGRRSSSSRRSMTMNINGQFCSHPCPVTCPDDYDPQCAISGTGQRRVFINHCKLDHNSCFYSVVWHKRPLAECVGGKKADMRQNRGFIGWMQRVGIVDNKGRLVDRAAPTILRRNLYTRDIEDDEPQ